MSIVAAVALGMALFFSWRTARHARWSLFWQWVLNIPVALLLLVVALLVER